MKTITAEQMKNALLKKIQKNTIYGLLGIEAFPATTILTSETTNSGVGLFEYRYCVRFPKIHQEGFNMYVEWCNNTPGFSDVAVHRTSRSLFFKDDKVRILFLLKWS